MGDRAGSYCFEVIRGISKNSKKKKKIKEMKKLKETNFFFENSFFLKITEIICVDGIVVPTAHHGRRPIAVPTAEPIPTAIWPMSTAMCRRWPSVQTMSTAFLAVPTAAGRRHLV
jgi:hypothetical protein